MKKPSTRTTTHAWLCLLAVGLLVLLAACGGAPATTGTGTTPTTAPTAAPTATLTAKPTPTPTTAPTTAPTATPTAKPTPTPTPATSSSVSIMNFSFSPNRLTVQLGTNLASANHDIVIHTVI